MECIGRECLSTTFCKIPGNKDGFVECKFCGRWQGQTSTTKPPTSSGSTEVGDYAAREKALTDTIDRLRGQLQNCVNHLERAKRQWARTNEYDQCIESANKALYETMAT